MANVQVRARESAATGVHSRFRRSSQLVERAHVVLRRMEQRLRNGQVAVDRSRRQVSASRELLDRLETTNTLIGQQAFDQIGVS
jgi:hypothetical protein